MWAFGSPSMYLSNSYISSVKVIHIGVDNLVGAYAVTRERTRERTRTDASTSYGGGKP